MKTAFRPWTCRASAKPGLCRRAGLLRLTGESNSSRACWSTSPHALDPRCTSAISPAQAPLARAIAPGSAPSRPCLPLWSRARPAMARALPAARSHSVGHAQRAPMSLTSPKHCESAPPKTSRRRRLNCRTCARPRPWSTSPPVSNRVAGITGISSRRALRAKRPAPAHPHDSESTPSCHRRTRRSIRRIRSAPAANG